MILGKSSILENIRSPEGRCDSISTRGPIVFSCVLDMGLKNFGHLTNILLGWPFFYPLKWFVLAGRTDWTDSVKKGPSLFSHYNIKHYSYRLNFLSKKGPTNFLGVLNFGHVGSPETNSKTPSTVDCIWIMLKWDDY